MAPNAKAIATTLSDRTAAMNTALAAADLNGSKEPLARLVYVRPARKYLARSSLECTDRHGHDDPN
jgi:hypothetical protein